MSRETTWKIRGLGFRSSFANTHWANKGRVNPPSGKSPDKACLLKTAPRLQIACAIWSWGRSIFKLFLANSMPSSGMPRPRHSSPRGKQRPPARSNMNRAALRRFRRLHHRLAQGWVRVDIRRDCADGQTVGLRQRQFGQQFGRVRAND